MADEVQVNAPAGNGNNRERLEVHVGSKSLGIAARDLISVLFIALIGVFLYLAMQSTRTSMQHIATNLTAFEQTTQQAVIDLKMQLQAMRELGSNQRQVSLDVLKDEIQDLERQIDVQTEKLRHLLLVHEHNQGLDPPNRLPLELPLPEKAR